jgi:polyhydroxybutyrate depolymerase
MIRVALVTVALVLTAAGLTGCGRDEPAPPRTGEATDRPEVGSGPGPCEGLGDDPGTVSATIEIGDDEREYTLHTPPQAAEGEPLPLVLNLHGLGSDIDQQTEYSELAGVADELGFVVLALQGGGTISRWRLPPGDGAGDDVQFVVDVLEAVGRERCIDEDRVFSAGISNGAAFSSVLACELADSIAGIGAVAGVNLVSACPEGSPVAVIAFHGTDDDIVPYDGGAVLGGLAQADPMQDTMAAWARRNGCDGGPVEERVGSETRHLAWTGCEAPVELYVVDGGGHTWPGARAVRGLGHVTADIDASRLILEAFAAL